jgi:hypothetical protein
MRHNAANIRGQRTSALGIGYLQCRQTLRKRGYRTLRAKAALGKSGVKGMEHAEDFQDPDISGQMILLGTGTSVGVPTIGCGCPVCTGGDPKNQRSAAGAAIVGLPEGNLLIDTPPESDSSLSARESESPMRPSLPMNTPTTFWDLMMFGSFPSR